MKHKFSIFVLAALILSEIPFINWPFGWMETFFHELSHGLAALLSGGSIERIVLRFDGSGISYTRGGWQPLVLFSGYAGAVIWGAIIYLGANVSGATSRWLAFGILSLLIVVGVLYARDWVTITIMLIIAAVLYTSFRYVVGVIFPHFMEFIGIYIMVSAAKAPLNLFDGRSIGDGAALATSTWVPEFVWALLWFVLAVGMIVFLWRSQRPS
ncbi:MAG: M50 family metallopeptidase [Thiohalomonadales bacterium]